MQGEGTGAAGDDQQEAVRPMGHFIAPLPTDRLPTMDWKGEDIPAAWERFKNCMDYFVRYTQCPKGEEWYTIILYASEEGSICWKTLKHKCDNK